MVQKTSQSGKRKKYKPRGPATFTSTKRKLVRNGAFALEQQFSKTDLLFITLTFPGSSRRAIEALDQHCGFARDKVLEYLRKHLPGERYWLYVWERQEKRGALHLTLVIFVPPDARQSFEQTAIREMWFKTLRQLSKKAGTDVFEHCDGSSWMSTYQKHGTIDWLIVEVKECENSVVDYVSKRLTKSETLCHRDGRVTSPGVWANASNSLRELIEPPRRIIFEVDDWYHGLQCAEIIKNKLTLRRDSALRHQFNSWEGKNMGWAGFIHPCTVEFSVDAIRRLASEANACSQAHLDYVDECRRRRIPISRRPYDLHQVDRFRIGAYYGKYTESLESSYQSALRKKRRSGPLVNVFEDVHTPVDRQVVRTYAQNSIRFFLIYEVDATGEFSLKVSENQRNINPETLETLAACSQISMDQPTGELSKLFCKTVAGNTVQYLHTPNYGNKTRIF